MRMTSNDKIILDNLLEQEKSIKTPELSQSDYFELFCTEQILKDFDLSYEEIQAGIVGGSHDGGIDSIFVFAQQDLLQEDTDLSAFKRNSDLQLHIIQAKQTSGFSESQIEKFVSATTDLLDLSNDLSTLKTVYNERLLDIMKQFHAARLRLANKFPRVFVYYYYATKSVYEPSPNVRRKVDALEDVVKRLFPDAAFHFQFLNAATLLSLARRAPITSISLQLTEQPISLGKSYICLVPLDCFYEFIVDEDGRLHRNIFEANVRDYQKKTEVNEEIQKTLIDGIEEDFWWLNNGITIVATDTSLSSKILTIQDPQIVNGLQTSSEIYRYFSNAGQDAKSRNILVRVIVPSKPESGERIIKATNSQTQIPIASLSATEKIHRDIEDYFKPRGLFYDRRKNFYKNEGKPLDKIIGISYLAQAVLAIYLQRPNDARGRPGSVLKKKSEYKRIFSPDYPVTFYFICASLMKRIEHFLKSLAPPLSAKDRNNLRFHLAMATAAALTNQSKPSMEQIKAIDIDKADDKTLHDELTKVRKVYDELGGDDQAAKSPDFVNALHKAVNGGV